ncbi:MAG: hypothetical protein F2534_07385 [Actinobacteria bacterium]|uniref:Unannotated protein n=1 Tax=freshwater metagenome TaxID=449393 RepID=A0A6J6CY23_9ZZZZ|nr:hypothetical protein [Actinomycetota bacterium]
MTHTKQWMLVVCAALIGVLGVQHAAAGPYIVGTGSVALSDPTPQPGQTVTVTAGGFAPNSPVAIVLGPGGTTLGTTTASGTGSVSATFVVPGSEAGGRTVVLSGTAPGGEPISRSVGVDVGGVADDMPSSGGDAAGVLVIAVGVLCAGALMWIVAARRRRPAPPAAG